MKVTREQAQANHERIVDAAAVLFRERGFEGVGVAEIMERAGLTHGGFYGHFGSKDELAAAACTRAVQTRRDAWAPLLEENPEAALATFVRTYLSEGHRTHRGSGCPFAALAGEAPRQAPPVRRAFADGLRGYVERFANLVPGRSAAARRRKAIAVLSGLVGALTLARAVDDRALAGEILAAGIAAYAPEA
ncbi:MAG TPA: helix-turn-helix domain-containing protein [Candidatus Sulfotelmatobacter sp.]|nr:helix-turn-helix domain-containing protein [Candidatus Sulfotelmatobacter sp.]